MVNRDITNKLCLALSNLLLVLKIKYISFLIIWVLLPFPSFFPLKNWALNLIPSQPQPLLPKQFFIEMGLLTSMAEKTSSLFTKVYSSEWMPTLLLGFLISIVLIFHVQFMVLISFNLIRLHLYLERKILIKMHCHLLQWFLMRSPFWDQQSLMELILLNLCRKTMKR